MIMSQEIHAVVMRLELRRVTVTPDLARLLHTFWTLDRTQRTKIGRLYGSIGSQHDLVDQHAVLTHPVVE